MLKGGGVIAGFYSISGTCMNLSNVNGTRMNLSSISISTQSHKFICFGHALYCVLGFKSVQYVHAQIQWGTR